MIPNTETSSNEALTVARRKEAIRTVASCFPHYAREIECACEQSSEFRSICADLHACARALTRWNEADTDDADERRQEYRDLLQSLEQEVLDWLGAHGLLRDGGEGGTPGRPVEDRDPS